VRISGLSSSSLEPRIGARQGCPLSLYLFNIFAEIMMRKALAGFKGGVNIGSIRLTNLRYADDIMLAAESSEDLQDLMNRLVAASTELGLKIIVLKTAAMALNTDSASDLMAFEEVVTACNQFKYLGVLFDATASGSSEFQARLNAGYANLAALQPIWRRNDISAKLRAKLVRALVFPVFTYGCEAWNLNKGEKREVRTF
jgi:hypothetical protein